MGREGLPYIADERDGVNIDHLISDADAGSWGFALGCGSWINFLAKDGNRQACNRAFLDARQLLDDLGAGLANRDEAAPDFPFHSDGDTPC